MSSGPPGSTTPQPAHPTALHATGLGFRFRPRGEWALRDCSFDVPEGRITALVGSNGAGKSTLFHLATDLLRPTEGRMTVFGSAPGSPGARSRTAFLAQDKPLYPDFSVADTLHVGRALNDSWDQPAAERVVRAGDIALDTRVGRLSGGQRSRVALALALGKRPDLLLLDEPLADLDPLVREEIMGTLMAEVAEREITVVLSSHVLPDIEHSCDHVLLLGDGRVRLAGEADELRTSHSLITGRTDGPPHGPPPELAGHGVVHSRTTGRQFTALVRTDGHGRAPADPDWVTEAPGLEDIVLGHLRAASPATARHTDGTHDNTAGVTGTNTGRAGTEEGKA